MSKDLRSINEVNALGDRVFGDPGTTQRECGTVVEVDKTTRRCRVQWDSGLSTYAEHENLEPEDLNKVARRPLVRAGNVLKDKGPDTAVATPTATKPRETLGGVVHVSVGEVPAVGDESGVPPVQVSNRRVSERPRAEAAIDDETDSIVQGQHERDDETLRKLEAGASKGETSKTSTGEPWKPGAETAKLDTAKVETDGNVQARETPDGVQVRNTPDAPNAAAPEAQPLGKVAIEKDDDEADDEDDDESTTVVDASKKPASAE